MKSLLNSITKISNCKKFVICGLPRAGKTTFGRLLANHLNWKFIDTDQEIEKCTGQSCKDLYIHQGEHYFRELEHSVICSLEIQQASVISLGGGALLELRTQQWIQEFGHIIYLSIGPELYHQRTRDKPLAMIFQDWATLTRLRTPIYERLAHDTLKAEDLV